MRSEVVQERENMQPGLTLSNQAAQSGSVQGLPGNLLPAWIHVANCMAT